MTSAPIRRLFLRSAAVTAGPPLVALPFWIADVQGVPWAGSLGVYEVVVVPVLLVLVAFMVYRKTRAFHPGAYLLALGAASVLGVGLWYLGLGLHSGALFRPDALTAELMGIVLGVQGLAACGAVLVIAGMRRMQRDDA